SHPAEPHDRVDQSDSSIVQRKRFGDIGRTQMKDGRVISFEHGHRHQQSEQEPQIASFLAGGDQLPSRGSFRNSFAGVVLWLTHADNFGARDQALSLPNPGASAAAALATELRLRIQINRILLIASLLSVAALVSQAPSGAFAADLLDRGPVKFNILNREGTATIGSSTYTADRNPDRIVLRGENRYLNGEFDLETEVFSPDSAGGFPNLVSFGHSFYNADGTPRLESHADFGSGIASCVEYRGPNLEPQVRTAA